MGRIKPPYEGGSIDYVLLHKKALRTRVMGNPHTLVDADVARYLSDEVLEKIHNLVIDDLEDE